MDIGGLVIGSTCPLMDAPHFLGIVKPVMFVCGEGPLKSSVILLVDQLGFAVIDAGELKVARLLAHSLVLLPVSRSPRGVRLGADSAVDLIFSKAQKRSRQVIFA